MAKGIKTGGRTKGTPNKKTINIQELLETEFEGFNPVRELITIYKTDIETAQKIVILKELSNYIYPKRKAIDCSFTDKEPIQINFCREYE